MKRLLWLVQLLIIVLGLGLFLGLFFWGSHQEITHLSAIANQQSFHDIFGINAPTSHDPTEVARIQAIVSAHLQLLQKSYDNATEAVRAVRFEHLEQEQKAALQRLKRAREVAWKEGLDIPPEPLLIPTQSSSAL